MNKMKPKNLNTQDCYDVIDRLGQRLVDATKRAKLAEKQIAEMRGVVEQALGLLCQGSSGLRYDPSWIRAKTMPIVEMREACLQAYHLLHKALSTQTDNQKDI